MEPHGPRVGTADAAELKRVTLALGDRDILESLCRFPETLTRAFV
jgi:hypothetical protein